MPRSRAETVKQRRDAYRRTFLGETGEPRPEPAIVLNDLARFCRAHKSTSVYSSTAGVIDPIASAQAEGRREVWLRILEHLHLSDRFVINIREVADNDG